MFQESKGYITIYVFKFVLVGLKYSAKIKKVMDHREQLKQRLLKGLSHFATKLEDDNANYADSSYAQVWASLFKEYVYGNKVHINQLDEKPKHAEVLKELRGENKESDEFGVPKATIDDAIEMGMGTKVIDEHKKEDTATRSQS